MVQLSRDEAQTLIYRGCARLAVAMQTKHITENTAQKWEDEVLREANAILCAAVDGPLTDLVIPPLPLALFEVQKHLNKRRPMKPSDIHSPFEQASTSPWAIWITHENDPGIPAQNDLGDPGTFWWKDLEGGATRNVTPVLVPLKDEGNYELPLDIHIPTPPPFERPECSGQKYLPTQRERDTDKRGSILRGATMWVELTRRPRSAAKRSRMDADELERSPTVSEHGPSSQSSKRYHMDSSSEDGVAGRYVYVPKCDRCREQGRVCYVARRGQSACTLCRSRKRRCSAYQGESHVVRKTNSSIDRKKKIKEESIVDRLRPRGAESTHTPFKPQHASTPSRSAEQPKIGPPGGKWMWQKRAERAATARHSSNPSGSQCQNMTVPATPMTHTSGATASAPATTPTASASASVTTPVTRERVLVDKSVVTESQPLERLGHQEAEFMKGLVSLILEVIQTHQTGSLIPRTVPASADEPESGPVSARSTTGRGGASKDRISRSD